MIEHQAEQLLENFTGHKPDSIRALAQSGSSRINFMARSGGQDYIITYNSKRRENEAFFYLSGIFKALNLNTPEIFAISEDRKLYIQEFLGAHTLSEILQAEGLTDRVKALVKQTLTKLYQLQTETSDKVDYSKTFEYQRYDALPVMNDLFYFKSFIADVLEMPYHKSELLKEFIAIATLVESLEPKVLMLRDFQSRNIMVNNSDETYFIDYQSAMKGPAMYDVVSLLFQAKADFPDDFKTEMLEHYLSHHRDAHTRQKLRHTVEPIKLMRFLQVLGAYGFRGLIQKKPHFLSSIGIGIKNLGQLAETWKGMDHYPELKSLIMNLKSAETQQNINSAIRP